MEHGPPHRQAGVQPPEPTYCAQMRVNRANDVIVRLQQCSYKRVPLQLVTVHANQESCSQNRKWSFRLRLKCDGTRTETTFRLSAKQTSPFKSPGASVQSITVSRGERISGSNAGYTMFRGSVKGTGYPLHFASFPFISPPVRHHVSSRFN